MRASLAEALQEFLSANVRAVRATARENIYVRAATGHYAESRSVRRRPLRAPHDSHVSFAFPPSSVELEKRGKMRPRSAKVHNRE